MRARIEILGPLVMAAGLAACGLPHEAAAGGGGLGCSVGEVVLENLKIGRSYSLTSLANLPLSLTNRGDVMVRVRIDAMIPDSSELRQGAEAIPDVHWASAIPETLEIPAHQMRTTDLRLTIPDDEKLFGRKFEAIFWSHTMPQPGELLAYGLKSRVIFTIDRTRDTSAAIPRGDVSISLLPAEVRIDRLVPGHEYRIEDVSTKPLTVRNTSDRPITVELKVVRAKDSGTSLDKGCTDMLDLADVKLSPANVTLAPGEEKTITGTLSMAKRKIARDQKLMCVISAAVTDLPVKTQIYSRIYAYTR